MTSIGPYFVALVAGVLVALQAIVNATIGKTAASLVLAGALSTTVSAAVLLAVFMAQGGASQPLRTLLGAVPWLPAVSGLLGACIITSILWSTPRISVANMIVLLVAGQLCISALADHFGVFGLPVRPLDPQRVLGMLAVAGGAWLVTSH